MASSTLFYIAWPLTLGLSFMAGSMILSKESAHKKSKVSQKNSSQNNSTNEHLAITNRRSLSTRSRAGRTSDAEPYDSKEIANTRDPLKRMTKLIDMIDQLGPNDFEQVFVDFSEVSMNSHPDSETKIRQVEYEILFNAWAKMDPQGALACAKENSTLSYASHAILSTWAEYAPDAAIQWVKLNHEADYASSYLVDIIIGITETNPERATSMLPDLLPRDRYNAVHRILPHISKLGTEKAVVWLANIKDEQLRDSATRNIASSLARKDPQATIDWLQTFSEDYQKKVYGTAIALAWAELDINKAAEWTSSLEGRDRYSAAQQIIHQFASLDPNKAAVWMKTMSSKDYSYKRLASSFIDATKRDHPEIALANLDQFPDQLSADYRGVRSKQDILRVWAIKNKDAATKWMQSNSMDTAAQEKVLSAAAKGFDRKRDRISFYKND